MVRRQQRKGGKRKSAAKRVSSVKIPVWIQYLGGKVDRIYWQNPNIKDFEIFRLTIGNMYGKDLKIMEGFITAKINPTK